MGTTQVLAEELNKQLAGAVIEGVSAVGGEIHVRVRQGDGKEQEVTVVAIAQVTVGVNGRYAVKAYQEWGIRLIGEGKGKAEIPEAFKRGFRDDDEAR